MASSITRFSSLLGLTLAAAYPAIAAADCTPITAVPVTLSAPGQYCLTADLTLTDARGTAILISANDVTVDLQGRTLRGPHSGGVVTVGASNGVFADRVARATIRNGRIDGFWMGVVIGNDFTRRGGHLVENLHISGGAAVGIGLSDSGSTVRNNRITGLDGNLQSGVSTKAVTGIMVDNSWGAQGNQITGNVISQLNSPSSSGNRSAGISVSRGPNTLIEGNIIEAIPQPWNVSTIWGVLISHSDTVMVLNNRMQRLQWGIQYESTATGKYSGNITDNVTVPYQGGTPVGTNF